MDLNYPLINYLLYLANLQYILQVLTTKNARRPYRILYGRRALSGA